MLMQAKVRMFGSESWNIAYIKSSAVDGKALHIFSAFICKNAESLHSSELEGLEIMPVIFTFSFFFPFHLYVNLLCF